MKKQKRKQKTKNKKTKEEIQKKRKETVFKRKIRTTFEGAGFTYYRSVNKDFKAGYRTVELDYLFSYENLIIICEDTCGNKKNKEHIRNKSEAFAEIMKNKETFINWILDTFPEKGERLKKYNWNKCMIFYFYIAQAELDLTSDEKRLYNNLVFIEPETLAYFNHMSQCIHYSARYEIFRFLNISNDQLGHSGSEGSKTTIKAPIIYPETATGLKNGIRVVSFMMSAEKLLKTCYVLRKDNWEDSIYLYQRLIEKEKIKGIRNFLASKGEAFYNNIIVALPDNISFEDDALKPVTIENVGDFQHCKLVIPDEMNSICIIDGQHRIFSHYEAPETDKTEPIIAELREQLHLLVTGLIFPKEMKQADRKRIQSEIFLEINDNTKKVSANVLTHIEMIKDPFSDIGLARRVIEKLNKETVFLNKFELSSLDEKKIKVASIIKFALRYLVTVTPAPGKTSLFNFWNGDKRQFAEKDEKSLNDYIDFCSKEVNLFFSAVRNTFNDEWISPNSKILSVTSINGFIMAFNRQLSENGLSDFEYYKRCLKKVTVKFDNDSFPFTSSQYKKFSTLILKDAFDFVDEEI